MSALCLWTTGCVKDSVLFVTTTNIGIDADTRPPHATIGYDRYEGYIGPAYSTGAIPPVFAKIDSNLAIFNPEIRQVYATGDAARLVTMPEENLPAVLPADGKMFSDTGRVMLFGTTANIGLRVTFAGNYPESLSMGYKRKEFSYIPLGSEDDPDEPDPAKRRKVDVYGSVIAAMDMGVKTPSFTSTALGVSQFFATGDAARNVAIQPGVRQRFAFEAEQALKRYECEYGPDAASEELDRRIAADESFRGRLADWLKEQAVPISVTSFIGCDSYADKRQQAVDALH